MRILSNQNYYNRNILNTNYIIPETNYNNNSIGTTLESFKTRGINGNIDDFRIYDRILLENEITEIYYGIENGNSSKSYMEDLRIWKKELTHDKILDCINIEPTYLNHNENIFLWYKFDNDKYIYDYSKNKFDGIQKNLINNDRNNYNIFKDHEKNLIGWYKLNNKTNIGLDSSLYNNNLTLLKSNNNIDTLGSRIKERD